MVRASRTQIRLPAGAQPQWSDALTIPWMKRAPDPRSEPEAQSTSCPNALRIEKRGHFVYCFLGDGGRTCTIPGASDTGYVCRVLLCGIGVCSHDKDSLEEATFANVDLRQIARSVTNPTLYKCFRTSLSIASRPRVVYAAPERVEGPRTRAERSFLIHPHDASTAAGFRRRARADQHRIRQSVQPRSRIFAVTRHLAWPSATSRR